jgi:hypothetical protein
MAAVSTSATMPVTSDALLVRGYASSSRPWRREPSHSRVSDWSYGPYRLSSIGAPGCQIAIGYVTIRPARVPGRGRLLVWTVLAGINW